MCGYYRLTQKLDRQIHTVPERVNPIPRRAPPTIELIAPLFLRGATNDSLAIANFCLVAGITESAEKLIRPAQTALKGVTEELSYVPVVTADRNIFNITNLEKSI